jgi:hypothetical protein
MRIIGILSYYNESPSWLAACVASMAGVCDHLVAVDGRYATFPDEAVVSPPEQAEAIVETAAGARLPLTLHRPAAPFFGDEVEKRNLTLKLAAAIGEPMHDWLLVLDADCVIIEHSDFLKEDLERCDEHSAAVGVEERLDPADEHFPMALAADVSIESSWRTPVTLLYRLLPNMRYYGTHYSLAGDVDGRRVWLWGHDSAVQPFGVTGGLVIRHRNTERPRHRQEQAAAYYATRDRLNIEQRP